MKTLIKVIFNLKLFPTMKQQPVNIKLISNLNVSPKKIKCFKNYKPGSDCRAATYVFVSKVNRSPASLSSENRSNNNNNNDEDDDYSDDNRHLPVLPPLLPFDFDGRGLEVTGALLQCPGCFVQLVQLFTALDEAGDVATDDVLYLVDLTLQLTDLRHFHHNLLVAAE